MVATATIQELERGTAEARLPLRGDELIPVQVPKAQEKPKVSGTPVPFITMKISAVPKTVLIQVLLDDRLRLNRPVVVKIEKEGEHFIAKCDEFEEYGYGHSFIEAVDDLRQTLVELYWTLQKEQSRLGPGLANLWQKLGAQMQVL